MIKFTKLQAELLADRPPDCIADAAEFEEITKKEFGNYKRAFKSVIKKLNKIGEGHESYPIKDSWMLYY